MFIQDDSSLKDCIMNLFDERSGECDYYKSGDYGRHVDKAILLDKKLRKQLSKKQLKKLWWYISGVDAVTGEKLAGLQESSYKRGFNDALILMGEIERAKNGLPSIFS
ncbi:hypothetical protein [Desulfosporosinus sp. SB140]|uniref:hypothetical protein n=1 Tax=Desulfosporosinus paludis TaxID=3115649 RepID=UPI00388E3C27